MKPLHLLILNDDGLVGGGTEKRIQLFVEKILENEPLATVHVLQSTNKIPLLAPQHAKKVFFHPTTRKESCKDVQKIIQDYSINFVQAHNLVLLSPKIFPTVKKYSLPLVWWAHDYWLLCTKRSFIDPYNASQESLCPLSRKQPCFRCKNIKTMIRYALWKKQINYANAAIAPSQILQEIHEYAGVLRGKWQIIVPWINQHYFSQTKKKTKDTATLLFTGSLIEFKGAWVLARALKKIAVQYPKLKVIFAGPDQEPDNKFRRDIVETTKRDGTFSYIQFVGKKTPQELFALYQSATAYICSTVCMESFGLNWAEAMAAGCPVIASNISSIPEYITHKKNGILFAPRDHTALADAVIELLSDKKLAEQIRENGKRYAQKHFTTERAFQELLYLYDQIQSEYT